MTTHAPTPDDKTPSLDCDLVMKGGITSGIVYPPAVYELAKRYRFRSIGGASAGAIAAALAAAAEYARQKRQNGSDATTAGGFEQLITESKDLSAEVSGTGESGLARLFRPVRKTSPLINVAKQALHGVKADRKSLPKAVYGIAAALLRYLPLWFLGGFLLTGLLIFLIAYLPSQSFRSDGQAGAAVWGILVLCLLVGGGVAGGLVGLLLNLVRDVGNNGFGICSGMADDPTKSEGYLSQWLCDTIQRVAGLPTDEDATPLTFGELEQAGEVTLRMMTTNISQGQPYVLPFEQNVWVFRKSEWRKLFPAYIVQHLERKSHPGNTVYFEDGSDYCFLPPPEYLPIAVGARMSLSFPLLISAIPLYTISSDGYTAAKLARKENIPFDAEPYLQRNWFSDGGMSSNFPIHFFDAWLPGRPTFGINLGSLPFDKGEIAVTGEAAMLPEENGAAPARKPEAVCPGEVILPRANDFPARPWQSVESLLGFGSALLFTMKDYRDNLQAVMPSYRERIVEVRLSGKEGGLNLNMSPETIRDVVSKGETAGAMLVERYADGPGFSHHLWTRYLVLMAQLEKEMCNLRDKVESGKINVTELTEQQSAANDSGVFPYRRTRQTWIRDANETMKIIEELLKAMPCPPDTFQKDSPKPDSSLRITPKI